LRLIGKTNERFLSEVNNLVNEGQEIVAIVSTIVRNALKNPKDRK